MSKCVRTWWELQDEQRDQNFAAVDKAAPECVYGLDECQTKSDIKNIRQLRR